MNKLSESFEIRTGLRQGTISHTFQPCVWKSNQDSPHEIKHITLGSKHHISIRRQYCQNKQYPKWNGNENFRPYKINQTDT